jgi:hypothetical protein
MKTNCRYEVVSRIAGRGLLFAGLLAIVLVCTGSGHAQSTSVAPGDSKTAAAAAQPGAPVSHPPGRAMRSGVKVHGYWKIDVKNPDGRLASHTEFENSLTTGDPNGLSGDDALSLLLSGGPSSLTFTSGTINTEGSLAGLQAALNAVLQSKSKDVLESVIIGFPYLLIGVNTNGFDYVAGPKFQSINYILPGPCGSSPCLAATSQSVNGNTISLSTTFGATAQSTISEVGTFVSLGFIKYDAKGQGFEYMFPSLNAASYTFTSANLGPAGSCGGPGQPSCQVSVSPGQTVAVSVALSFN